MLEIKRVDLQQFNTYYSKKTIKKLDNQNLCVTFVYIKHTKLDIMKRLVKSVWSIIGDEQPKKVMFISSVIMMISLVIVLFS